MDKEQIKAISESIPMEQRFSVEQIVSAAIESYKAELLKEVGEPFAYAAFNKLQSCYEFSSDQEDVLAMPQTILPTFDLYTSDQLAASQLHAKQLREALENHSGNYKLSKAECKIINDLLDKPHDTSALDAYVSEKVKDAEARTGNKSPCYQIARDMAVRMWERHYKDDAPNWQPLDDFMGVLSQISNMLTGLGNVEELTRQRDLAVAALEAIAGRRIFIDNLASNVDIAVMTLDAIKESEGK